MKRTIIDTIKEFETIIIHRHVRPDPDAYGSAFGLKEILQASYPEKQVVVTGEHDDGLSFLAHPDIVEDELYEDALIIVTDTANTARIDDQRYRKGKKLVKIDHHPNDDNYGDIVWVDTNASSTSEMIYQLAEEGKKDANWSFTDNAAKLLFAGIIGDTGRFMFQSTTKQTFEAAGNLIEYGFDRSQLFNEMYEVDVKLLHLQGYIYQNFKMNNDGIGYIKLTVDTLKSFDVSSTETSLLVGSLGAVKNMKAWVMFIEERDQIRVRLRSKGLIINEIAKKYNGGGHPLASGASVYTWDEADHVIRDLEEAAKRH
ncbi:DHH family phosphoesterase [Paenisporosarcina cavernae]|uniref:Bifunctional oligoribonuclease/PAP phosphatase NrnA n=1 Tax=Paenisporosarcina cavernae TaxID=2320858 RepID=A0A385YU58_9BACL|nr:bifunctional oligoribonuclease/PAP phosphatase NrnA [Paenisporosarcina cavernae]AYC29840.1 bifunctional oligoribonuclease/PAP phosphatase NrnA [Paenisporosarcina cavernae]